MLLIHLRLQILETIKKKSKRRVLPLMFKCMKFLTDGQLCKKKKKIDNTISFKVDQRTRNYGMNKKLEIC